MPLFVCAEQAIMTPLFRARLWMRWESLPLWRLQVVSHQTARRQARLHSSDCLCGSWVAHEFSDR
jgi:hypothetical protein